MSKNLLSRLSESLDSGELLQIADDSLANKHVLTKLGFSSKGQYVTIVRKFLEENDVDTSHFTTNGLPKVFKILKYCLCCNRPFHTESRDVKEQVTCSRACSNTYFRSGTANGNYVSGLSSYRHIALKVYGCKCNRCGYSENEAAIVVHHKDHNRDNNSIENLEVLCANCHAIHHWTV